MNPTLPYLPALMGGLAYTVAMIVMQVVNLLKPWIEMAVPDGSPRHDSTIQLVAILLNEVALFGAAALLGQLTPTTSIGLLLAGVTLGIGSIGAYHLSTGSSSSNPGLAFTLAPASTLGPITPPPLTYPPATATSATEPSASAGLPSEEYNPTLMAPGRTPPSA